MTMKFILDEVDSNQKECEEHRQIASTETIRNCDKNYLLLMNCLSVARVAIKLFTEIGSEEFIYLL